MIVRIWQGWTAPENADAYERLLKTDIFPGIVSKNVAGYLGVELLRRPLGPKEVEFVTVMRFDSWESLKAFAGEEYQKSYVPPQAREVLKRFDPVSRHYELRARQPGTGLRQVG